MHQLNVDKKALLIEPNVFLLDELILAKHFFLSTQTFY